MVLIEVSLKCCMVLQVPPQSQPAVTTNYEPNLDLVMHDLDPMVLIEVSIGDVPCYHVTQHEDKPVLVIFYW